MTILPIVERELRVASRKKSLYWARWIAACFIVVLGAVQISVFHGGANSAAQSQALFRNIAELAFYLCFGAGIFLTADCLSVEKRENTMGLLFLTDLRGEDVVLGKVAAHSLTAFYGLLSIYPLLAVPLTIGGVSFGEFFRMTLVLTNTFFFSLAAGVLISALFVNERTAMSATLLFLMVCGLVLPSIARDLVEFVNPVIVGLMLPKGYTSLAFPLAFTGLYERAPYAFWQCLAGSHALAWVMVGAAAGLARALSFRENWGPTRKVSIPRALASKQWRTRLLNQNPILWLSHREPWKEGAVWGAVAILVVLWLVGGLSVGWYHWMAVSILPSLFLMSLLVKIWIASEASSRLVEDNRSGALELLLSTPITESRFLEGQLAAIRRQFSRPMWGITGVSALLVLIAFRTTHATDVSPEWTIACVLALIFLMFDDARTLALTGMRTGLELPRADQALIRSLILVLVLPWALWLLPLIAAFEYRGPRVVPQFFLLFGVVSNAALNCIFRERARDFLMSKLRQAASMRFQSKRDA